jgi:hypothetical protein
MKRLMIGLCAVVVGVVLSGCETPYYTRTVEVKKDGSGKVIETVETETIHEPHGSEGARIEKANKMTFKHLQ